MILKPGTRIGHYEVLALLGAGGIGMVYRVRDRRLGRDVAIKVLRDTVVKDPRWLARFEREARLLAVLNHPRIASIYGLEESGEVKYLVLELVPGETLAQRLTEGPLTVAEALNICCQIAEALEAAHEKGIVHRDLKPENVKVTPEEKVKILDFGLAKDLGEETPSDDPSESPTAIQGETREGVILGTAGYMSPRQARGKLVDKRADIWAFGCVLYEALTGRQAFEGGTFSDTLAAVLEHDPDWSALPRTTPVNVQNLLRRCLQKDPQRRLRDIGDARIELEEALAGGVTASWPSLGAGGEPQSLAQRRRAVPWPLASLITILTALATGMLVWSLMRAPPSARQPPARYTIDLPPEAPLAIGDNPSLALSPDGARLVYVAAKDGDMQLFLRSINRFEAQPIPGARGARAPFFSPDGEWVGYFDYRAGELRKVSLRGGAPITICDADPNGRGASWGPDNRIVFSAVNSGLLGVSAAGGEPRVLTRLDRERGERTHRFPHILPGGDAVLFMIGDADISSYDDARIAVVSSAGGEKKILIEGGSNPRYTSTGHIVYARAGSLMAVPFDLDRLRVTGSPFQVLGGVVTSEMFGAGQFSLSLDGTLVYLPGGPEAYYNRLVWVDRKGVIEPLPLGPRIFRAARFSPHGRRLALQLGGANDHLWLYDVERGTLTRLTVGADNVTPVWTPDGRRLIYAHTEGGSNSLIWKHADGSSSEGQLLIREGFQYPASCSPDGNWLSVVEHQADTGWDIWTLPVAEDPLPQLYLGTRFNETQPVFSPDGQWLAYVSDESGRNEVYLRPFPGPGRKRQISTQGGAHPLWGPNRRELFYYNDGKMMAVSLRTKPAFSVGMPKLLFENRSLLPSHFPNFAAFDIAPDGQRFVMVQRAGRATPPTQLRVVLNWIEELKQRPPKGNN